MNNSLLIAFESIKTKKKWVDDFFGFSTVPFRLAAEQSFMPKIDMSESEKEVTVTADLPGLEEKDIEVSLDRDVLAIKGEKKSEKEEKEKNYYYMERSSGSFYREIPVPAAMDKDNIKATFKNGVLKVVIPKLPEAQKLRKTIPVKTE